MNKIEFVVFRSDGLEIDWYDPYESHFMTHPGVFIVKTSIDSYEVKIPDGGWFDIRHRETKESFYA